MKPNKQSERSKKWIIEALFDLLKTKSFHEITVKDLTDKAGVARLTFYRNFETKEDVLAMHYEYLFSDYLSNLDSIKSENAADTLTICFEYWKKNRQHIKVIIDNHLEMLLYKPFGGYLETMLERCHITTELSSNQKKFIAGGLFCSMLEWISNENSQSAKKTASDIVEMLNILEE